MVGVLRTDRTQQTPHWRLHHLDDTVTGVHRTRRHPHPLTALKPRLRQQPLHQLQSTDRHLHTTDVTKDGSHIDHHPPRR
ncbi:hypothetical protein, partial [Streptomyces albidoflavus]|uniref:hypothetical protein n=1 Tax=Streptomyces albidoflavus TaxID=1886 RepID=UPI0021484D2D